MTQAFENMLYLLGAGARGYDISAEGMDMDAVRKVSIQQGVWPFVYKAAEATADVSPWKSEFILAVARSVARREFTLSAIKKMEDAGVRYCLMKGAAVANLYDKPECRISGDADIFINPADEPKAEKVLKELGYSFEKRERNDHHLQATHPVGGLLEVHVRMYSKTTEKIIFNGKIEYSDKFDKIDIDGTEFYTMGVYDGLVYLTAHYIKHLLNSGCGIRQILDLLLYMEKHKNEIDFDKYNKLLKELSYDKLIDVIKSIGGKYFGFDYPVVYPELMEELLTDMEKGGTFGYMADDRTNFYSMYCQARSGKLSSRIYMAFNREDHIIKKLFPSKAGMVQRGYKYASKGLLLPMAWCNRLFDLALKKGGEISSEDAPEARTEKRLDMIRRLDMIK